jgi:hypothetical protein
LKFYSQVPKMKMMIVMKLDCFFELEIPCDAVAAVWLLFLLLLSYSEEFLKEEEEVDLSLPRVILLLNSCILYIISTLTRSIF